MEINSLRLFIYITIWKASAILIGITAGVSASLLSIWAFSSLFHLSIAQYISLLPKSITTAIGLELSGEFGGIPAFTAAYTRWR